MKRVLVYGISGGVGGVETVVYNTIKFANREVVQFDIISFYESIDHQDEYEKMGVRVFKITSKHESPLKNKKEMKAFFQKNGHEYDAVWCNLAELINIDILKYGKKCGIKKRIIHSHSVASTRNSLLTKLHYYNKKIIGNIATDFWACSEAAGRWFYDEKIINSNKFQVIKNAINTDDYLYNEELRNNIRESLELKQKFVVGHVGRFSVTEKNTLFLLEVFKEICEIRKDALLLLVGDGNDRPLVERRIEELGIVNQVIMTGFRKDVPALMNAMDVFVLPSNMEGLGIVLVEAQANGMPCFTSDKVVPKEVAITELLQYIDLKDGAKVWAKAITSVKTVKRYSRKDEIERAGYDIKQESKQIERLLVN